MVGKDVDDVAAGVCKDFRWPHRTWGSSIRTGSALCYVARLDVAGRRAWTSVLYRVDDAAGEVLIVALISGP